MGIYECHLNNGYLMEIYPPIDSNFVAAELELHERVTQAGATNFQLIKSGSKRMG